MRRGEKTIRQQRGLRGEVSAICLLSLSHSFLQSHQNTWPQLFMILPHPHCGPQRLQHSPFPQAAYFQCLDIRGKRKHWADFATREILVYAPFIVLSPKQSLFSLRMVGQRPNGTPSPVRRATTLVWSLETREVKKTHFSFYPTTALEKTPVSQQFIFLSVKQEYTQ